MVDAYAFEHEAGWSADGRHVARARAFAARCLTDHGLLLDVDDVRIVVSELVTNAVVHAATAFTVNLTRLDGVLTVTVADGSHVRPHQFPPVDGFSTQGRGLRLVEALSSSWGVTDQAGGKAVWATFEVSGGTRIPGPKVGSPS